MRLHVIQEAFDEEVVWEHLNVISLYVHSGWAYALVETTPSPRNPDGTITVQLPAPVADSINTVNDDAR